MTTTVGVVGETAAGERRVALTPDGVRSLLAKDLAVVVESGAGRHAFFDDAAYLAAGARVAARAAVCDAADVIVCVNPPGDPFPVRAGQLVAGLLTPLTAPGLARRLAEAKVTMISLDLLPRTLSRAQSMDALTAQANIAGYKAALVAATAYSGYFPMLMTAAGTTRPAQVLVLGAGVAGLQAIATARRLGALVTGYDIRPAAHDDIRSTGAAVLEVADLSGAAGPSGAAGGGYARELSAEEARGQQAALDAAISQFDVVITTAQVPGRRPPLLVSAQALAALRPGSVVVDLAASELGGNVHGSRPEATDVTAGGVTVIGAGALPSTVPAAASTAYSRTICALLSLLIRDGVPRLDLTDEIQAGVVVTHDGQIVHPQVRAAVEENSP
ncbi:MAG: H+-translocating transhydrogenase subunit alpha [Actinoplanes sp.]|nr:H+-translocating transhydrogenase subunit alpha [Actinoplanes sp.]